MKHIWLIEEKLPGEGWVLMNNDFPPEAFRRKSDAGPMLREWRTCMPDHYRYRVTKYVPEVK